MLHNIGLISLISTLRTFSMHNLITMANDKGTLFNSTCFSCERSKPLCNSETDYCDHKCNVSQRCKMSTDLCLATMPSSRKWVFTECFPLPAFESLSDYPHGQCSMKLMAGKYTCLCRGVNCNANSTFTMASNESTNALSAKVNQAGLQPQNNSSNIPQRDEIKRIVLPAIFVLFICAVIVGIQVLRRKRPKRSSSHSRIPVEELLPAKNPLNLDLKEVIGRGSFGTVWLAQWYDRQVAVKISKPERVTRWYSEKEIFALELCHPNVISFIASEVRLINGQLRFLIILEYIDGGDLRTYLKNNVLSLSKVVSLIGSLARGLSYLHSAHNANGSCKIPIAHRDLKSSNVLLRRGKECLITDFGLAVALPPSLQVNRITEKLQVGTPRYMSPEKLNSRINLMEPVQALQQIDIYALALTMYEVISRCSFRLRNEETYFPAFYQLPFQSKVGLNPSTAIMKEIVLENQERPYIPSEWHESAVVASLLWTVEECWDIDPDSRLTASCVVERMKELERHFQDSRYPEAVEWFDNSSYCQSMQFQTRDSVATLNGTTYTTVTLDNIHYSDGLELV